MGNSEGIIDLGSDVAVVVMVSQKHAKVIIPHEVGGGEHVFECVLESHVELVRGDALTVKIVAQCQCELRTTLACYFAHAGLQMRLAQFEVMQKRAMKQARKHTKKQKQNNV